MSVNWLKAAVASVAASFTVGCAGGLFPKNFDPATGRSVLVFADYMPKAGSNGYLFRRIDRQSGQFVGPPLQVMLYPMSYWQMGRGASGVVFSVMSSNKSAATYAPGDYALVGAGNSQGSPPIVAGGMVSPMWEKNIFVCFADGAPVFVLRPSEIAIVSMQALGVGDSHLAAEFAQVRAAHTDMKGEAHVADMRERIKFGDAGMGQAECSQATSFSAVAASPSNR